MKSYKIIIEADLNPYSEKDKEYIKASLKNLLHTYRVETSWIINPKIKVIKKGKVK